jgi:hypothetical protein
MVVVLDLAMSGRWEVLALSMAAVVAEAQRVLDLLGLACLVDAVETAAGVHCWASADPSRAVPVTAVLDEVVVVESPNLVCVAESCYGGGVVDVDHPLNPEPCLHLCQVHAARSPQRRSQGPQI